MHRPPTGPDGFATDCEALNRGYCAAELLGNEKRVTREIELIEGAKNKRDKYALMEVVLDRTLSR
ncbi:MAG: hypothetical protein HY516_05465 [Candidatus Aenigmarchaeota archaeon]|nr:hypothetical protein [Candidatus Aenigmarchaeota archaeon]